MKGTGNSSRFFLRCTLDSEGEYQRHTAAPNIRTSIAVSFNKTSLCDDWSYSPAVHPINVCTTVSSSDNCPVIHGLDEGTPHHGMTLYIPEYIIPFWRVGRRQPSWILFGSSAYKCGHVDLDHHPQDPEIHTRKFASFLLKEAKIIPILFISLHTRIHFGPLSSTITPTRKGNGCIAMVWHAIATCLGKFFLDVVLGILTPIEQSSCLLSPWRVVSYIFRASFLAYYLLWRPDKSQAR